MVILDIIEREERRLAQRLRYNVSNKRIKTHEIIKSEIKNKVFLQSMMAFWKAKTPEIIASK